MSNITLTLDQVQDLATKAIMGAGATEANAASVAKSTWRAERDGIRSHGLLYVPIYAQHVECGKVDGQAVPEVEQTRSGAIRVNAENGFAHPAIDAGWDALIAAAKANGVAAMTVHNSYNCGVLGHHAERFAEDGMLGLCFTHAPASIAPTGGKTPVVGTNPWALGVPDGKGGAAIVIDQSASAIAKSEILLRSKTDEAIEPGWAFDKDGKETLDPHEALKGSMAPSGGYKGFGIGLLVEVMASCLAGAYLSKDAGAFAGTAGGPPNTGQCFLAFDTTAFAGASFVGQIEALKAAISNQEGTRIPGERRFNNRATTESQGVEVDQALLDRIQAFVKG